MSLGLSTGIPQSSADAVRGIGFMVLAVALFAAMDVLIKWLSADYPTMQLVFFRSLFAFLPLLLFLAGDRGRRSRGETLAAVLRPRRLKDHLLRSTFGLVSMICFFYAFGAMPLADVIAISFAAPLFMTAFSVWMLREQVGVHRWSAVVVGFLGVLLMVQPGEQSLASAAAVALLATICYALAMIYLRRLSRTESSSSIVFYFTLFSTLCSGLVLPFQWVTPGPADALMLIGIGLIGGVAQMCMTTAYRLATVSIVAPFDYTGILWGCLFGWWFWAEVPGAATLMGALVVVASGLYILHRETRRRTAA